MKIIKYIAVIAGLLLSVTLSFRANAQPQNADKIVAVVGENVILYSDIEGQYAQYLSQGMNATTNIRCDIMEGLLTQKILQNQAEVDSIDVSEQQVEDELSRRLNYFINQIGSQEKLEQFIGKSTIEFKEELRDNIRSMIMAQNMQAEITRNVKVTPAEVKKFYNEIPKDSLPYFNTEVQVSVIVKKPEVSRAAKQAAKDRLEELRARVAKGEDFATLAILYSQDGSAKSGGELGFVGRGELVKAFESVAFKLKPGELSSIVETEFGFHIVQLIERRGEQVNVRHILIKPQIGYADIAKAKEALDSVYLLVTSGKMTFIEAAAKFSDDEATKNNGGALQNPQDGTSKIPTDQLDPSLFFVIDNMTVGSISMPTLFKNTSGEQAYRIVNYVSKTDPHQANLKDDYQKIQQAALSDKQGKIMEEWFAKKRKSTFIRLDESYRSCEHLAPWYERMDEQNKASSN